MKCEYFLDHTNNLTYKFFRDLTDLEGIFQMAVTFLILEVLRSFKKENEALDVDSPILASKVGF